MTDAPFQIVQAGRIPADETHDHVRFPVREHLDIRAFGVNLFYAPNAGDELIEEHSEVGGGSMEHEELYFVVGGSAEFILDGMRHDTPAGTFVFVRDPAVTRAAVAVEAGTSVLAVGAPRGRAYRVAPWEFSSRALRRLREQDPAGASAALREGLELHPDDAGLRYDLACAQALGGERETALAELLRAAELRPEVAGWAQDDPDLATLRDDPRFPRA